MISYKEFEKHINAIQNVSCLHDELYGLSENYNIHIEFPSLIDNVVELLEHVTNDTEDLIGRWIFEWDFGRLAEDFDADLSTIEGLWKRLIK